MDVQLQRGEFKNKYERAQPAYCVQKWDLYKNDVKWLEELSMIESHDKDVWSLGIELNKAKNNLSIRTWVIFFK